MKISKQTILAILSLSLLVGCSSVKRELGVARNSPDEFTVVKRAPLTLPPDYTLRAPVDGALSSSTSEVPGQTKEALMGRGADSVAPVASADKAFLEKLGAADASADIRAQINQENGYIAVQNRAVADKLIFWKDEEKKNEEALTSEVDPKAEAERLKKNQAEGKSINEGDVPVIKKKQGTIDKLF